jgi:hypothetical protein
VKPTAPDETRRENGEMDNGKEGMANWPNENGKRKMEK